MASQIQSGTVTVQGETPDVLGGLVSGITTGADWAMKNYELQNKKQAVQAEMAKARLQAVKAQADVNDHVYKRVNEIIALPKSPFKVAKVGALEEDLASMGQTLGPTSRALMLDDQYQADLIQGFNWLNSQDPLTQLEGKHQLLQALGKDKFFDLMKAADAERNRNDRAKLSTEASLNRTQMSQEGANARQEVGQSFQNLKTLKADAKKVSDQFKEVRTAVDAIKRFATSPNGVADQGLLGNGQVLTEQKTSVLREGDVARLSATGGAIDRLQGFFHNLAGGGKLGPKARMDFLRTALEVERAYEDSYLDRLSPTIEALKSNPEIRKNEVLTADQIRLLGMRGIFKDTETQVQPVSPPPNAKILGAYLKNDGVISGGASSSSAPSAPSPSPPPARAMGLTADQVQAGRQLLQQTAGNPQAVQQLVNQMETRLQRPLTAAEKRVLGLQ